MNRFTYGVFILVSVFGVGTRVMAQAPGNDNCDNPLFLGEVEMAFTNTNATSDGPAEGGNCPGFENGSASSDVWFCHTSACTGVLKVSLCCSEYDTTLAVYDGCECPSAAPLGCNDQGCGPLTDGSRLEIPVVAGESLLIRVGGFKGDQGNGTISIECLETPGILACGAGAGACLEANGTPGCDDESCCTSVCDADPFCCDCRWDSFCLEQADGLCGSGFAACGGGGVVDCGIAGDTIGCSVKSCCQAVCEQDTFCCVNTWDSACVATANAICHAGDWDLDFDTDLEDYLGYLEECFSGDGVLFSPQACERFDFDDDGDVDLLDWGPFQAAFTG